jgi:hypothetical protein
MIDEHQKIPINEMELLKKGMKDQTKKKINSMKFYLFLFGCLDMRMVHFFKH